MFDAGRRDTLKFFRSQTFWIRIERRRRIWLTPFKTLRSLHRPAGLVGLSRGASVYPYHEPRLIGDIYDASLDLTKWTVVLEEIAEFIGGRAAARASKDSDSAIVRLTNDSEMIRTACGSIRRHIRNSPPLR